MFKIVALAQPRGNFKSDGSPTPKFQQKAEGVGIYWNGGSRAGKTNKR